MRNINLISIIILKISLHGTPQSNYLLSWLILIRSTDAIQKHNNKINL